MTIELNEPILPDDYPVYADHWYVADGIAVRSGWHGITVAEFKRYIHAHEIRRCDITGRRSLQEKP